MLTRAEALSWVENRRVIPDKLTRNSHGHYLTIADEMIRIYAEGANQTRSELHHAIEQLFWNETCPPKRIKAFCKLLDDASDFEDARGGEIAELRMQVFTLAAPKYPLTAHATSVFAYNEKAVKEQIALNLEKPWEEIETELFSDVYELQRLRCFNGYESPSALLARYNEAQIQAALYSAVEVRVTAKRDYRAIVMAAKRAMLMHAAERLSDGSFRFTFYGPVSPLRTTKRYGVLLARLIPTLLTCKDWEMVAPIKYFRSGPHPELRLSSGDKFQSSLDAPPAFDSAIERKFAEKWGEKPRNGWTLERESEPRFAGQKAFFPDFTLSHESGLRILMEIVGHWTPEYLQSKRETLKQFSDERIILAVSEGNVGHFADCNVEIVPFKTAITIEPIENALRRI